VVVLPPEPPLPVVLVVVLPPEPPLPVVLVVLVVPLVVLDELVLLPQATARRPVPRRPRNASE